MTDMKKKTAAQKLFARYKTYEGEPGSPEQWRALAAAAIDPKLVEHLKALGINKVPSTQEELKQARRTAIRTAHPDRGGDPKLAAEINAAFDQIEKMIVKPQIPTEDLPAPSDMLITPARCTADMPEIICEDPLTHKFTESHVAEIKMNGEREMLYLGFCPYGRRQGTTMLSRQKSKHDKMFGDKTDNVPHITGTVHNLDNTILDGEIWLKDWSTTRSIMGSAPGIAVDKQKTAKATLYVFDIPFYKGKDVRQLSYRLRRKLVEEVVAELNNPYIVCVQQFPHTQIDEKFREVVAAGGEGLVVKNVNGGYGQGWAKYKKAADVSCFIIGYIAGKKALEGMVGSLELGVYVDGKVISVGCAGGFTNALRTEITNNRSAYLGRVLDVFAFELTDAGQLSNGTFHRFRDDINKADCTLEKLQEDLKKVRGHRNK